MHASRYVHATLSLARSYAKRLFRDPTAMFFTFLFPVMFLLVFGSLNRGDNGVSFDVAVINHSQSEFAKQFVSEIEKQDSLKVKKDTTTLQAAKEQMGRGELDSILEFPENFGSPNAQNLPSGTLAVYYEQSSPQSGQTLAAIMQGNLDQINQKLTSSTPPLKVEQRSTATANLSSFDYIFAGLLGFTILSLGVFGLANSLPAEKKNGVFRRLKAAPIGASQIIFANGIFYLGVGLMSLALMFVIATLVFDFNMRGNYIELVIMAIASIVTMFGFGLLIGGWARNENQSAALTNVVAFPLMFLSGVFFPRFLMPEWLQNITGFLPLTPIVDGIRFITTEGKGLLDLGPQFAVMGIWTVVVYFIAIKIFRWE